MATSGTRTFTPKFAEMLSEAFSRIQIRPLNITQEHIDEAVRSTNLMLIGLANQGIRQVQLQSFTLDLDESEPTVTLPVGCLDIWSLVVTKDGQDTPCFPMSRTDYQRIPRKDQEGRPFNYFVERGELEPNQRTVTFWPTPDGTSADTFQAWGIFKHEDATGLPETLSVGWEWFDAYAAELSARLAEKFAPELLSDKRVLADKAFLLAKGGDKERAPLRLRMRGYTRGRRF